METLQAIQNRLKAPKDAHNDFGNYYYRSCESILEALKPLLKEYKVLLTLTDDVVAVGDRVFIKATATYIHGDFKTSVTAFAREALEKKGMDDSQITGTASSYARKYALNGLFLIDDTKDADTNEYSKQANRNVSEAKQPVQSTSGGKLDFDKIKAKLAALKTLEEFDKYAADLEKITKDATPKQQAAVRKILGYYMTQRKR